MRMIHNIIEKNAKIAAFTQHLQIVLKLQNAILGKSRVSKIPRIPMNLFFFFFCSPVTLFLNTLSVHYGVFFPEGLSHIVFTELASEFSEYH